MSDRHAKQLFSGGRGARSGRRRGVLGELGQSEYRVKLEEEDRRQLALDLAGLLQQGGERLSLGELAADWLTRVVRVRPENEQRHVRHMAGMTHLREPGRAIRDDDLTKAAIEHCFAALDKKNGGTLGPASLNKVRSTGKLIIDDAIANRRWLTANPFDFVRYRRVPKKPWPRVTSIELGAALEHLRPDRRREAVVMIHMGFRPGELKALQRVDIDFKRGFVTVQRSLDRDETKTGNSREVPIPEACRAVFEEALRLSRSALVFPRADGSMQRADTKLSRTLRTAFKAAGVITGYACKCRRKGCGYAMEMSAVPPEGIDCPRCGFRLWCDPIPKRFTWYGLRHAAATLHREAGADALAVKTALGWVQRDVGDDVYTHLSDERYRSELNKLAVPSPDRYNGPRVDATASQQERRMGFEPTTPSLGTRRLSFSALGLGLEPLLSTRDVASVLGVSTDTVYRLRRSGELPAVSVASCLRFHRLTVEDFVRQTEARYDTGAGTGTAGAEKARERPHRAHAARRGRKLH
jgi:excisionase family DNA binding protein